MKSTLLIVLAAIAAQEVAAHATFQDLWINGVDYGAQCIRLPLSNSPVTNVTSNDIRCNAGTSPVAYKCVVAAGSTVSVEIHQVSFSQL
jgi:cellulase